MKDMEYGPHLIDETFDMSFRMQLTSEKNTMGSIYGAVSTRELTFTVGKNKLNDIKIAACNLGKNDRKSMEANIVTHHFTIEGTFILCTPKLS